MNTTEGDDISISINIGALVEFLLDVILISGVVFLPIIITYLTKDAIDLLIGPFSPISVPYLTIVGLIIIWYIIGFRLLIPRLGKRINNYIDKKYG